jgi:glutaredoxin
MNVVEIYSKDDCHLCDSALAVLKDAQKKSAFDLKVTKLREGDENFEMYKERFPVIFINKEFAFQYKVSERQLLSKLEQVTSEK